MNPITDGLNKGAPVTNSMRCNRTAIDCSSSGTIIKLGITVLLPWKNWRVDQSWKISEL